MRGERCILSYALARRQGTLGGIWLVRIRNAGLLLLLAAVLVLAQAQPASAMTPAGTVISNIASADYGSGPVYSNEATFTVLQVAAPNVAPEAASATGSIGQTVYFPAIITNSGNGPDSMQLSLVSAHGWLCQVYRDDNADGVHQDSESTTIASTGPLAAGSAFHCFAAVFIPGGSADSDVVNFTATSTFDPTRAVWAAYTVSVLAAPLTADFSATPTSGTAPLSVSFSDLSTGAPSTWLWSFDDGATSASRNPAHEYANAGVYTVSLTVSNTGGQDTTTKASYITVSPHPLPVADFTGAPTTGTGTLSVTFQDKSSGNPNSWHWNFGDTANSTERNPVHAYNRAGKYSVSLTVSNPAGQNTVTKADFVTVAEPPPVADFVAAPTSGEMPLTVVFSDLSTGVPTSWAWSFGDGATSIGQNPTHEYGDAGSYTVSLTATNAGGVDTETKTGYIVVSEPPPPPPVADFSASTVSGEAPLSVAFTDASAGQPTSWAWNFGDGSTSLTQNPTHEYRAPGAYTVSLTVANAGGEDTQTKTDYIVVSDVPPAADFTASATTGTPPLTVSFADLSSGNPTYWYWEFGDGSVSDVQDPVHSYQSVGTYTVSLTVTSELGTSTVTKPDHISVSFSDVSTSHWAYREIVACVQAGIVSGYPDGKFHPNWSVNRDQMAAFLARAVAGGESLVPDGPSAPSFSDVPRDYWAYDYIEYATSLNIVEGYSGNQFAPTKTMDRGHMAVFLARAIVDPTGEEGLASYVPPRRPTFRDVSPDRKNSWCYKHVEYLASLGVTSGYLDSRFGPTVTLSRDETAVFLARAFELPM